MVGTALYHFIRPALSRTAPYIPATAQSVQQMLPLLQPGGSLIDLGSGDGRLVLAAAAAGHRAVGVELNYFLVLYSRYRAWRAKRHPGSLQTGSASFVRRDLWKAPLAGYDNIVVFGVQEMVCFLLVDRSLEW